MYTAELDLMLIGDWEIPEQQAAERAHHWEAGSAWGGREIRVFFSILLTQEGSHREVYRDFQHGLTFSAGGAKDFSDHRFRAPPTYTALLLTLHHHRANNQYRTANQI